MKIHTKITAILITAMPVITFAQLRGTQELIQRVGDLVKLMTTIVMGIALLAFFWGLTKYIFAQGSENDKLEAKKIMGWGLVALFVMMSVWGIVAFMQRELDLPVNVPGGSGQRSLSEGCGPLSQGYQVECDNQFGDF